jgi:soluble lytic murein transglycosylase-like protein
MPRHRTAGTLLSRIPNPLSSSFPAIAFEMRTAGIAPRHRLVAATGLALVVLFGSAGTHAQPAAARPITNEAVRGLFAAFVTEASQRFGIPGAWIYAVMRAESFGNARAISSKGAIGLMQIMPETWAALRVRYGLGADPYDAHDNIFAGAAYLSELRDRYGIPGFLAAYNAGPAQWEDHLATGRPLPAETRAYLARLAPIVGGDASDGTVQLATVVRSWTEASLFPERSADQPNAGQSAPNTSPPGLSVGRSAQDWTGLAPQSDGLFVALSRKGRSP